MDRVPIAFYAPLKPADHPVPSGDRAMARLLLAALREAGFAPEVPSTLRTHDGAGDPGRQAALRQAGRDEARRIAAALRERPAALRPRLWFTYHVYYKAPDWIGPCVADALGIPYVVAEGSRAAKRAAGPWAIGHEGAEAALDRADAVLVMTRADRPALERARPPGQRLVDCPPFVDAAAWPARRLARPAAREPALLAVAMMRRGDKLASYALLAGALGRVRTGWTLDVVGDGEARPEVEALLAPFGDRVRFHGRVDAPDALSRLYAGADLLVWPAVNEAYGLALLEAQACGLPVLAGAHGGVPDVVRDGETGCLTAPGDAAAFSDALDALLRAPERLEALSAAAARFVATERDLAAAATRLRGALEPLTEAAWA